MHIICRSCAKEKPLSDFSTEKKGRFEKKTICKLCANKVARDRICQDIEGYRSKRREYKKKSGKNYSESVRRWEKKNPEKARIAGLRRTKRWNKNHPDKVRILNAAQASIRKKKVRSQMPKWANKKEIAKFYLLARSLTLETGIKHEVDHIVPIRGRTVCGLHCEANLQVCTSKLNQEKSNKFWPDMF